MKKTLKIILSILVLAGGGAVLYYDYCIGEPTRYFRIYAAIVAAIGYVARGGRREEPIYTNYKKYEEAYKDIIGGVFAQDPKSYKKLLRVCVCYNRGIYKEAYELLDELDKKCTTNKERVALLSLRGIILADQGRHKEASEVYEKVVQYDMTNSLVWSNLGLSYVELGRTKEAYSSYKKAIEYDPENPNAYSNMATLLIQNGEAEEGLPFALKAIELKSDFPQPISWAIVAYKMLGDDANVEKYISMYKEAGGNEKSMREFLKGI